MRNFLAILTAKPVGILAVLALAAFLEAMGDSMFQSGLYRASGSTRLLWMLGGTLVLGFYGLTVNAPSWDFGKLLGVYVVLFFLMAQLLNKVRFHQSPTLPIYAGGALIVVGGGLIAFWKP